MASEMINVIPGKSGARARRAYVCLQYLRTGSGNMKNRLEGEESPDELRAYLSNFSFTGCASGEADRIEISLVNRDGRFFKKWMPRLKDKLKAVIVTKYWKKGQSGKRFNCGTFLIDPGVFLVSCYKKR